MPRSASTQLNSSPPKLLSLFSYFLWSIPCSVFFFWENIIYSWIFTLHTLLLQRSCKVLPFFLLVTQKLNILNQIFTNRHLPDTFLIQTFTFHMPFKHNHATLLEQSFHEKHLQWKKDRKIGENSGPLMLLPVNRLQCRRLCQ